METIASATRWYYIMLCYLVSDLQTSGFSNYIRYNNSKMKVLLIPLIPGFLHELLLMLKVTEIFDLRSNRFSSKIL